MALPQVDRDAVLRALNEFDANLRQSAEWANWDSKKSQLWALPHGDRLYPPKRIIAMATGQPVNTFDGGPESNDFLAARGFTVRRLREPALKEYFETILDRYGPARQSLAFGGNHEIRELFTQARKLLESWPATIKRPQLHVVASYGKGNWANIPWISLLDERETKTTQDGTYVVYLFREDGGGIYLKLGQGVNKVERELGAGAVAVLEQRAAEIRAHCTDLAEKGFDVSGHTDLGTTHRQARLYEASTVASVFYPRDAIPDDEQLQADLEHLLEAYSSYVAKQHSKATPPVVDSRRLSLIGTWRTVSQELPDIKQAIAAKGGWASWWSFSIREEALVRLQTPFYLYAYAGDRKLTARLRVDALSTSRGNDGIESPWPTVTPPEWIGKRKCGEKQSEVFKTWFRVGSIEPLVPALSVDDFELAIGLSNPENVLNQNSFGYVIEEENPPVVVNAMEPDPAPLVVASVAKAALIVPPPLKIDWLVHRTGLRQDLLQEIVDSLLGPSPQIMLAGPPGTSKTWLARQLALYLTRDRPELMRFVQFHASYSYESFIEGLRPVTRSGGVSFELTPGVVVDLAREMRREPGGTAAGNEYVIVIDEANRANLPRVLGELMFLFEYREQSVRLQYSGEFSLPANLRFIGTMNTADRSIRSIDVALRRRFDVFELGPDPEILNRHYESGGAYNLTELASGFAALNLALETHLDRHHTIGHAFFMRQDLSAVALKQIWRRRVFPLIEEFFFDQPDLAREFSLERFWPSASSAA